MFSATFFFLGIAGFVVAALACLSRATRAGRCVEVELGRASFSIRLSGNGAASGGPCSGNGGPGRESGRKGEMAGNESDLGAVVCSLLAEGRFQAESHVFVGSHALLMCRT